jgi:hypothetical protein
VGCGTGAGPKPEPIGNATAQQPADPAHIAGRWAYRTRSSCENDEGVGWVEFVWDGAARHYEERGEVAYPYLTFTFVWSGTARLNPATGRIDATVKNNIGDVVTGGWVMEGDGPDRLTTDWAQENGCTGTGVATRD